MSKPKLLVIKENIVSFLTKFEYSRNIYPNYILLKTNAYLFIRFLFYRHPYYLEIHAADHCNLNCQGCSAYSPISEKIFLDIQTLKKDLFYLRRVRESFEEIRVMGGEPLLNKDIALILRELRTTFKSNKISIVTNGLLLERMRDSFWESVRLNDIEIRITVYPNVNIEHILNLVKGKNVRYSIYGTRVMAKQWRSYLLNEKGGNKVLNYYHCGGIKSCWQLYDGKIIGCSTSAYAFNLNRKFGSNFQLEGKDYLPVDESLSRRKLLWFAFRVKKFCRYCVFPTKETDWQKSAYSASEWIANQ